MILSKNNLGDLFADKFSQAIQPDQYIKSICLKYNKIGKEGLRNLASAVSNHGGILSLDVRNNPCY